MKIVIAVIVGVLFGFVGGYWLHGAMAAPLGSNVAEHRVLTSDLDLGQSYFFAPSKPPVIGTIRKGSEVAVSWRKSSAAYVEISTVVEYDQLAAVSSQVARK